MPLYRTIPLLILISFLWLLTSLAHADFEEGLDAFSRKDYATALMEWLPLAEQGHALAQYNLGFLYTSGQGVPQDYVQAVHWFRKAAEQGHALAQNNLGALYNHGRGVPQDYDQARKWYRKAAAQGQADAQNNLGVLYANGWGVSQDFVQAHMWFNLAAAQGQENARKTKEQIAKGMTAEQIAEAQQLAHEWKAKPLEFSKYTLTMKKNNTLIHLQGGLGLGVSDEVNELLATNSDVNGIILDSQGGWIHEGRKLADLISSYGLDTYSLQGCYSACTTAFIAGGKRLLSPSANLGFHQYHVPDFKNLQTDVRMKLAEEQDRKLFQQQGISAEFLEKLFNTSFDDLWYPPVEEMLTAQVIHGHINPSDISPIQYGDWSSSDTEKILLDIPVFHTIKKYDPSTFKQIIDAMDAQAKKGATPTEIKTSLVSYYAPIFYKLLPQTSNEALIDFAKASVSSLRKLEEEEPILCVKFIFPEQYGETKVGLAPTQVLDEMNEVVNRVIIDAYEKDNPQVDTSQATFVMEKLALKMGDGYIPSYSSLEMQNSAEYKQFCDWHIKLFELILTEDNDTAGNTLRYVFGTDPIDVAPDLSVAELPLIWSDNPGAFEQHLIRRYKNPLFPKVRREITQAEIAKARERDNSDYEELNDRLITLIEDISSLSDYTVSSTFKNFRERIDDLIQDAMGVGGQAYDIATKTKQLHKALILDWAKGLSENPEGQRTLEAAERFYQVGRLKFEMPFFAQTTRKDSPIPNNEIIPALLMEQPTTIAMTILGIDDSNKRAAVQQEALHVLNTALDEGAHIEDLEEKLRVLEVPAKYLKELRAKSGPLTPLAQDESHSATPFVDPAIPSIYSHSPPKLEKEPDASDGSRDSASGLSPVKHPYLTKQQYLAMVEDKIDHQWVAPPLVASNPVVVLKFRISRSGEISNIRIDESSGNGHYDSAARRAVYAVNPLPAFPPDISDTFFEVRFRFIKKD